MLGGPGIPGRKSRRIRKGNICEMKHASTHPNLIHLQLKCCAFFQSPENVPLSSLLRPFRSLFICWRRRKLITFLEPHRDRDFLLLHVTQPPPRRQSRPYPYRNTYLHDRNATLLPLPHVSLKVSHVKSAHLHFLSLHSGVLVESQPRICA